MVPGGLSPWTVGLGLWCLIHTFVVAAYVLALNRHIASNFYLFIRVPELTQLEVGGHSFSCHARSVVPSNHSAG
jgi:hypothetical protein